MSLTIMSAFGLADDAIRAAGDLVESLLQLRPQSLHVGFARVLRHTNNLAARDHATAEGEIYDRAVPVIHTLQPACRDRYRQNRPPGFARKHDDSQSGLACHFRHVSRE